MIKSTPYVQGKALSAEEWARGIMAIAALAGDNRAPWLAGLEKAVEKAKRILRAVK